MRFSCSDAKFIGQRLPAACAFSHARDARDAKVPWGRSSRSDGLAHPNGIFEKYLPTNNFQVLDPGASQCSERSTLCCLFTASSPPHRASVRQAGDPWACDRYVLRTYSQQYCGWLLRTDTKCKATQHPVLDPADIVRRSRDDRAGGHHGTQAAGVITHQQWRLEPDPDLLSPHSIQALQKHTNKGGPELNSP